MKVCVTGGSGFLGRHLVRQLIEEDGYEVRVLCRNPDVKLRRLGAELFPGSVLEEGELEYAFEGCDAVFHLAGRVERDPKRAHELFELHVTGTRNVLAVAKRVGVARVVYASTSGVSGVSTTPQLIDDDSPYAENIVKDWPYYQSKLFAEKVARDAFLRDQQDVVILRPTLLLGPDDERISSTMDVLRFLQGKMPVTTSGGLSLVDVRDAAAAFRSALHKGRAGETYLLGSANLSVKDFFARLARLSGKPEPRVALSDRSARLSSGLLGLLGKKVRENLDLEPQSLEMGRHYWYIDWTKAIEEIDFRPRDPGETLYDTIDWLQTHVLQVDPVSWESSSWSFDDEDYATAKEPVAERINVRELSSRWTRRAERLVRKAAEVAQNVAVSAASRAANSNGEEGLGGFFDSVSSSEAAAFTGVSSTQYTPPTVTPAEPSTGGEIDALRGAVQEQAEKADAEALQAALWAFRRMQ